MRFFLILIFSFTVSALSAQKFALLDKSLARPVTLTDHPTQSDKFDGLFPVEKSKLSGFIAVLEDISKKLSSKEKIFRAEQYNVGCTKFRGILISLASGDRLDYTIISQCSDITFDMHLCDPNSSNATNAFFIRTWIKYIKDYTK